MPDVPVVPSAAPAVPPAPAGPTTNVSLAKDWHWLAQHLVLILILASLAMGGVYLVESIVAKHDDATAARYSQQLALDQQTLKQLSDKFDSSTAQHAQEIALLTAQNNTLRQQVTQRDGQLLQQVKLNATLTAQQLASKLADQLHVQPTEVVASNDTVSLDLPATHNAVDSLDGYAVAKSDLSDTQKQLENETQVAQKTQSDLTDAKGVIAAQATTLGDSQKACDAQIKKLKADNRKSTIKKLLLGGAIVEGIKLYFFHTL